MNSAFTNLLPTWYEKIAGDVTTLVLFLIVAIVFILLKALLVMVLWNWVVPKIFPSVRELRFWESLGLILLLMFLF